MRKKIISFAAAAAMTLSITAPQSVAFAEEAKQETQFYCILSLNEKPLAEYKEAQELGVDRFIFTDSGKSAYDALKKEQKKVKAGVEELLGRKVEQIYSYTAASNGICIVMTEKEYKKVNKRGKKLGIDYSFMSDSLNTEQPSAGASEYGVSPDYNKDYSDVTQIILEQIGAEDSDYRGEGMVIGVIDNEFDLSHEFFTMPESVKLKLIEDDVKKVMPYLASVNGSDVKKLYMNEKIPYAFDYEQKDTDTKANEKTSHGTHVAGIAAGYGVSVKNSGEFTPSGVAPEAQLVLMQAETLKEYAVIAALDDMLYLGADVVNCSFGTTGMPSSSKTDFIKYERGVYDNMKKAGVTVCAASGNSGRYKAPYGSALESFMPDTSTSGIPDGYKSTFSVGSAQNYYETTEGFSCGGKNFNYVSDIGIFDALKSRKYNFVVVNGVGSEADFDASGSVKGKIAVYDRGLYFSETSKSALDRGAVGVIICNNPGKELVIPANDGVLPICMISYSDGAKLKSLAGSKIDFNAPPALSIVDDGGTMSSFSTWGPSDDLRLSVDITAFGGRIYSSAYTAEKENDYEIFDGTSMASPQMAGCAAIIKHYLKENAEKFGINNAGDYPYYIEALAMSTAVPISFDNAGMIASPRVQGSGLIDITAAVKTPAYLYTNRTIDSRLPKVSLGDDPKGTGKYEFSFFIKNVSDHEVTYDLSCDLLGEYVSTASSGTELNDRILSGSTVVFKNSGGTKINSITVNAGGTKKITVIAELSEKDKKYIADLFDNGSFVEGFVYLKNDTDPQLSLPFTAFYGDWAYSGFLAEPFVYTGEAKTYEYSFLCSGPDKLGYNYIAMLDPFIGEGYDYNIAAFSPNGDGLSDELNAAVFSLRAADKITLNIYNKAGEKVFTSSDDYVIRSIEVPGTCNSAPESWNGKDTDGKVHNGEWYTVECIIEKNYNGRKASDTVYCDVTIDNKAPKVMKSEIINDDEYGKMLHLTVKDDTYIMGANVYPDENTESEPFICISANHELGSPADIYIPIEGLAGTITYEVVDIAMNVNTKTINVDDAA